MSSRTATILVTDLVGSTERRVAMGEERAEDLRRIHDRLLAEAVAAHDGEVVKGLGDGVLALFSGAAEAVGAAVDIQQAVAAHSDRHPDEALSVRVGISAGDVTLEDDDCFGTPVVEASRLCAEAGGDEILVADLVRLLARGRGDHEFEPAGERVLKGLPDAVAVATVSWSRSIRSDAPVPAALQSAQWFDFAGRAGERDRLLERWKAAAAGEPALVVVSGEPGIGKTRLVAELAAIAHDGGASVLYGRSEEELDVAFRPWTEALSHLVAHLPAHVVEAHVEDWGGDITRLVPAVHGPEPARGDPDTERLRLFGATVDLLTRAGEELPVLVVLDDLHWADESSLLLLRHLVRHLDQARVLVVGTYRDTDLSRAHPLATTLADLRREAGVERVDLVGLDLTEVTDFLTLAGGDDADPEEVANLAQMVSAETEGNPFFIGEVLVHLVESGALVQRDGRWEGDRGLIEQVGLPEGIREVIGRRLAGLDEETNELLRTAAVVGAEFDASVVAAALDRDVEDVVAALDDAAGRRLVVEDEAALDRFRFAHALIRQTLLEELRTSRRVRLHHRVALALEARGASAADLAHHFGEAAALADADKAIGYAGQAADEAAERLAFEQAIRFRRLAVETEELLDPPDAARRAGLLLALGALQNVTGQMVEGRDTFVAAAVSARTASRPDLLARAAHGYGGETGPWLDFTDTVGPSLLDEALAALPEEPSAERALALAGRSLWRLFDPDPAERLRLSAEALEMAEAVGEPAVLMSAARVRGEALKTALDSDAILQLGDRLDQPDLEESGAGALAMYYRAAGSRIANDLDGFRAVLTEMQALDPRRQVPNDRWSLTTSANQLALDDGQFALIELPSDEEVASIGQTGAGVQEGHEFTRLWLLGRSDDAAEAVRKLAHDLPDLVGIWPNLAWADWLDGDLDGGADRLRLWQRDVLPAIPASFRVHAAGFAAPMAAAIGMADLCEDLAEILLPHRGKWATWCAEVNNGLVDHALGLVDHAAGRAEQGLDELRTAVADYRTAGTRARLTLALCDLALLADDADARAEALTLADELGMAGVTRRLS